MTKLLYISDTHLGYEAYGSRERAEDLCDAFVQSIDIAIERNVDAVIHTGDITHYQDRDEALPDRAKEALETLQAEGIGFHFILGNHDQQANGTIQNWAADLEFEGLANHLNNEPEIVDDVAIYGVDYHSAEWWKDPVLNFFGTPNDKEITHTILCLHQSLGPFVSEEAQEVHVTDILNNASIQFDSVACGHLHAPQMQRVGGVPVFYGGATERITRQESNLDPGVHLLEINDDEIQVTKINLETRPHSSFLLVQDESTTESEILAALDRFDVADNLTEVSVEGQKLGAQTIDRCFDRAGALDNLVRESNTDQTHRDPGLYLLDDGLEAAYKFESMRPDQENPDLTTDDISKTPTASEVQDGNIDGESAGTHTDYFSHELASMESVDTISLDEYPERFQDPLQKRLEFISFAQGGGSCNYAFKPDDWKREIGGEPPIDEPWVCPHDRMANSQYCAIHQPWENWAEKETELTKSVKEILETKDKPRYREFIGARLPAATLAHFVYNQNDNYPLDFRCATILGTFSLHDSQIDQKIILDGAWIGRLDLSEGVFRKSLRCENSRLGVTLNFQTDAITGEGIQTESFVTFDGCHFAGNLNFRDSEFNDTLTLSKCRVEGSLWFHEGSLAGETKIRYSSIGEDLRCFGSEYDTLICSGTTINGDAKFQLAKFQESAYFQNVDFTQQATFKGAYFGPGSSKFRGANFGKCGGETVFEGASFVGPVHFSNDDSGTGWQSDSVTFHSTTNFKNCDFENEAHFEGATFGDTADFEGSSFMDDAYFIESGFEGRANFEDCTFYETLYAKGAEFYGNLNLIESEVRDLLNLTNVIVSADITASECDLEEIKFQPEIDSEITSPLVFDAQRSYIGEGVVEQPDPPLLIDLTQATVGDIDFSMDDTNTLTASDDRQAEGKSRTPSDGYNEETIFSTLKIDRTDFEGFDFKSYRVILDDDYDITSLAKQFRPVAQEPSDPGDLEVTYLKARKGASLAGDPTSGSNFFIEEMKQRRRRFRHERQNQTFETKRGWLKASFPIWKYGFLEFTSKYGERPIRIVVIGLAMLALSSASYALLDFVRPNSLPARYSDVLGYIWFSMESSLSMVLVQVNDDIVQMLSYTQGFLTMLLVALLIYSITRATER